MDMDHQEPPDGVKPLKIVLVGDVQVGKTSIIQRFIANHLPNIYIPTGFDKYSAAFEVTGRPFYTTIWDTSGSPTYDTVRPLVYQDTDVFLLCFNLADWYSLHNIIQKWYPEIRAYTNSTSSSSSNTKRRNTPIILVGCQNDQRFMTPTEDEPPAVGLYFGIGDSSLDCKRKIVFSEEALEVSRQIGALTYVETCAYNPLTVREAFEVAALAGANGGRIPPRQLKTVGNSTFYGLKSFRFAGTNGSLSTMLSSPTESSASTASFDNNSSCSGVSSKIIKSSSSSTHLTGNRNAGGGNHQRSTFKLRKCKSRSDVLKQQELAKKSNCSIM